MDFARTTGFRCDAHLGAEAALTALRARAQGAPIPRQVVPFWGGFMSQWAPTPFVLDGEHCPTAEHYMMMAKAAAFEDARALQRIRATPHPKAAKAIGRCVAGYRDAVWARMRYDVVVTGNLAKFRQCPGLKARLRETGDAVLVEASPTDRIWGVGLAEADPRVYNPAQWQGANLLGFALMDVRRALR